MRGQQGQPASLSPAAHSRRLGERQRRVVDTTPAAGIYGSRRGPRTAYPRQTTRAAWRCGQDSLRVALDRAEIGLKSDLPEVSCESYKPYTQGQPRTTRQPTFDETGCGPAAPHQAVVVMDAVVAGGHVVTVINGVIQRPAPIRRVVAHPWAHIHEDCESRICSRLKSSAPQQLVLALVAFVLHWHLPVDANKTSNSI